MAIIVNKKNIDYTLKNIHDGDIIKIEPGEYFFNETILISGCKNVEISAINDNDKPIFNFKSQQYGKNGVMIIADNVLIKNIVIKNSGGKGLFAITKNSTFDGIETCWNCNSGFQLKFSSGNKVINCKSHHNIDYETTKNGEAYYGANADGFSDKQHSEFPNEYIGCKSWNNSDDGFDFYERKTDSPTVLIDCIAINNGMLTFDLSKSERISTDKDFFSQFSDDELKEFKCKQAGNGFKLGGNGKQHNIELHDCISIGNQRKGFDQNSSIGKILVKNCISDKNHEDGFAFRGSICNVTMDGCISFDKISIMHSPTYINMNNIPQEKINAAKKLVDELSKMAEN